MNGLQQQSKLFKEKFNKGLTKMANKLRTIDFLKIYISIILVGDQTQDHRFS